MTGSWSLDKKKALITGATKGIGLAITWEFLSLGAELVIVSRDRNELDRLARNPGMQGKVRAIACDVSSGTELKALFNKLVNMWSALDIVVNNVGMNIRKRTLDYDDDEFDRIMNTNLRSVYEISRLAHPLLKLSGSGSIVNISSVAGQTHVRSGVIYGMTKAAINQMTKNLACEWAGDSIRVNAIAPWYIDTPLVRQVLDDPDYLEAVLERTPAGRIGTAREVAATAAFLCMEEAGYITGQCIAVDGGFSVKGF